MVINSDRDDCLINFLKLRGKTGVVLYDSSMSEADPQKTYPLRCDRGCGFTLFVKKGEKEGLLEIVGREGSCPRYEFAGNITIGRERRK